MFKEVEHLVVHPALSRFLLSGTNQRTAATCFIAAAPSAITARRGSAVSCLDLPSQLFCQLRATSQSESLRSRVGESGTQRFGAKRNMRANSLHATIVGGGIGGLSAANALLRSGLRVSVFEQAAALGEVGAGVFIYPNSLRQLERMGFGPALARVGAKVGRGSEYYRMDGTVVGPILTHGFERLERPLWYA